MVGCGVVTGWIGAMWCISSAHVGVAWTCGKEGWAANVAVSNVGRARP